MTEIYSYEITQWATEEVRAVTRSFCRQKTLTINVGTEIVHTVTTDLDKDGCPLLGALDRPRLSTLEDGFRVAQDFFKERKEAVAGVAQSPIEKLRALFQDATK